MLSLCLQLVEPHNLQPVKDGHCWASLLKGCLILSKSEHFPSGTLDGKSGIPLAKILRMIPKLIKEEAERQACLAEWAQQLMAVHAIKLQALARALSWVPNLQELALQGY